VIDRSTKIVYLTPPVVAKQLGISPAKVIGWIARHELEATNVADRPNGRPRWVIATSDLEAFLRSRSSTPTVPAAAPRRRRRMPAVTEYF